MCTAQDMHTLIASFCAGQYYTSKYYIAKDCNFEVIGIPHVTKIGLKRFANALTLRKRGDVRHIVLGKVVQIHDDASQVELHARRQGQLGCRV